LLYFAGYCMLLRFCNSFISLKTAVKIFEKKYLCVPDAIMYHP